MPIDIHNPYDGPIDVYVLDTGTERDQGYDGERISLDRDEIYTYNPSGEYAIVETRSRDTGEVKSSSLVTSEWGQWEPP